MALRDLVIEKTRPATESRDKPLADPEITTAYLFHVLRFAYEEEIGPGLFNDYIAVIRILSAAEEARAALAVQEFVTVDIPFITIDKRRLMVGLSRTALLHDIQRKQAERGHYAC